jgi:hypothetical protein
LILQGSIYCLPDLHGPLRQGEVLSIVEQYVVYPNNPVDARIRSHPYAVVLSQDCDLAQDFTGRFDPPTNLNIMIPNVLLCEIDTAENLRCGGTVPRGTDAWKQITQNKIERFHYLSKIDSSSDGLGQEIPALLVDFKRNFTAPTDVLYQQIQGNTKRRTVLRSPYMEHLSSRYAYFISRIALPVDHHQA